MEHETEGTVPPPLRPPEQWVWVEAAETALGSGASLLGDLPNVSLVVESGMWHLLFEQPGACTP